jgi:hypothetical protein
MKIKNIQLLIIGIFFLFSCKKSEEDIFKEYIPLTFNGDKIVESRGLISDKHNQNIIHVFKFYDITWKKENNKIYVLKNLNEELLWNFTSKVNDSIWLKHHPINN